jgi:hypothetical protein
VKTLIGFALGTMLSLGTVTSATAAAMSVAAPVQIPAGIEVIVVTAKRPAYAVDAAQPIDEFIVTAKRAPQARKYPTPPAMAVERPKLEFAVDAPPVVRL